ncbi:MAG: homoserine kinase [Bacteroidetes bacterium]|nr:homoserine kinase [Bacteroidota bacterium]
MSMITAFAPATIANLGSAFDIAGLAICTLGDFVTVTINDTQKLRITSIAGDGGKLPLEAEKNTCTVAMQSMLDALQSTQGVDVTINKKLPLGSGLGSSAASAVAGVVALNKLLGTPFSKQDLIPHALAGEFIASKAYHADNIAPCMLGGITICHGHGQQVQVTKIAPPAWFVVVLHQPIAILTSEARKLLPSIYAKEKVIEQTFNLAALLQGFHHHDANLVKKGMEDNIAVPFRKQLIPNFDELMLCANENNAIGSSISGSGPTVFALCESETTAQRVKRSME